MSSAQRGTLWRSTMTTPGISISALLDGNVGVHKWFEPRALSTWLKPFMHSNFDAQTFEPHDT